MSKNLAKNVIKGYMKQYDITDIVVMSNDKNIAYWGDIQPFMNPKELIADWQNEIMNTEVIEKQVFNSSKIYLVVDDNKRE